MPLSETDRNHMASVVAMILSQPASNEFKSEIIKALGGSPQIDGSGLMPGWTVPPSWIGRKVFIDLAMPLPKKDGSIAFPATSGTLIEDRGGALVYETRDDKGIQHIILEKSRMQQVRLEISPLQV